MIMNIESFNISKNVLYKLINKINPVRFRAIAGGLALLSILALPGCSLLEPENASQARQPHGRVGQA